MNDARACGRRQSLRASGWRMVLAVGTVWLVGCSKTDDRPYVWAYISPAILQPNCASASCHSRAAAVAGLDFSTPERGYQSLTKLHVWIASSSQTADGSCQGEGDAGWLCPSPRSLVVPYAPGESRLVAMLRARNAPRMPPDRPLTEPDIALIETWILNGASATAGVAPQWEAGVSPVGDGASRDVGPDVAVGPDAASGRDASMDSLSPDAFRGIDVDGGLSDANGDGPSDTPIDGSVLPTDAGAGQ